MPGYGARISKDDWMSINEKQERKKRQNRLNQRALRERRRKDEVQIVSGKRPYRVSRWRIGQAKEQHKAESLSSTRDILLSTTPLPSEDLTIVYGTPLSTPESEAELLLALVEQTSSSPQSYPPTPESVHFPLSADHLIHLIHQNVFSALMNNKSVLAKTTYLTKPAVQGPSLLIAPSQDLCEGMTLIHLTVDRSIPKSLHPTPLQSSIPHSSWLNMFPWPGFRDNLILHEPIIDACDLLYDLFGDLVSHNGQNINDVVFDEAGCGDHDDDIHSGQRGLIVWGDPWDTEAWEVTHGFMQKWSWLLNGCEGLVEASNRWRRRRNEDPLRWQLISG